MYISDTENTFKKPIKTSFIYLLISIFCALFGAIYEIFSHEVYSFYMLYAFVFPLVCGTLTFMLMYQLPQIPYPNKFSQNSYHSGIATLTVGSIIKGVLEIYGTTNYLTNWYFSIGIVFVFISIVAYCTRILVQKTK